MIAVKLTESDVKPATLQVGGDAAAAAVNWKDAVVGTVGDEDALLSVLLTRNHETGFTKTRSSARSKSATSTPKLPPIASQVVSREFGAR